MVGSASRGSEPIPSIFKWHMKTRSLFTREERVFICHLKILRINHRFFSFHRKFSLNKMTGSDGDLKLRPLAQKVIKLNHDHDQTELPQPLLRLAIKK